MGRKTIKFYTTYVNFEIILFLVSEKIVFLSEKIWNIKLDVKIVYGIRHLYKLTWIECRFIPVRRLIPLERALNSIQHMWIWQNSYVQHRRKLCFYIEREQLMNMMICSRRGAIRSFLRVILTMVESNHPIDGWIEGWIEGRRWRTSQW